MFRKKCSFCYRKTFLFTCTTEVGIVFFNSLLIQFLQSTLVLLQGVGKQRETIFVPLFDQHLMLFLYKNPFSLQRLSSRLINMSLILQCFSLRRSVAEELELLQTHRPAVLYCCGLMLLHFFSRFPSFLPQAISFFLSLAVLEVSFCFKLPSFMQKRSKVKHK